jgi:hypothetical protein
MKIHLPSLLALAAVLHSCLASAQARDDCPIPPPTVYAMRDCYRPLIVFSPDARDHRLAAQQALLDHAADDMMDRNLLFVPVLQSPEGLTTPLDAPYVLLNSRQNSALRQRFNVGPKQFLVVLLGEDGEEKLRSSRPLTMERLNELIDSMPTRKQERVSH